MWLSLGALGMSKICGGQEGKPFPLGPWLFSIFLHLLPLYILSQLQASTQPLTCLSSVFLEVLNPFFIARAHSSALHTTLFRCSRKNEKKNHSDDGIGYKGIDPTQMSQCQLSYAAISQPLAFCFFWRLLFTVKLWMFFLHKVFLDAYSQSLANYAIFKTTHFL